MISNSSSIVENEPTHKSRHPGVSFFTRGKSPNHKDSYIIINQSYVQHIRPLANIEAQRVSILFIHGGGLTGAQWESTPDRRPGWAVRASEAGYPIYILDCVDSGRSQAAPSTLRSGDVEHRTAQKVWTRFRLGFLQGFGDRRLFGGSQVVIEALDGLVAAQAVRRRTTHDVEMEGDVHAIEEIGQCIVVAHSHGAALVMDALDKIHALVRKLVLIEPGETAVATKLLATIPTLLVWGDFIQGHKAWVRINNAYRGAPVDTLVLPNVDVHGNSQVPMLDRNSDEVWKRILRWL